MNCTTLNFHDRSVHCLLHDILSKKSGYATFIYAYPQKEKQRDLWKLILNFNPFILESWALLGDFNNICSSYEKIGGSTSNSSLHRAISVFNAFVNDCGTESLHAESVPFTWSNGHQDDSIYNFWKA